MKYSFVLLVSLLLAASAVAAPLTGTVTDARGAPVAGAQVGDYLAGGPFAVTNVEGRYTLDIPDGHRVVGAWRDGFSMAGPRWLDARSLAASADFTLLPHGPLVLSTRSLDTATDEATVGQVEVAWRVAPVSWRLDMTLEVTDANGHNPHDETRTYFRCDFLHPDGILPYRSVIKMAPVVGVKHLTVVITQPSRLAPQLDALTAYGPAPTAQEDAVSAMRIAAGFQDPPTDPDAFMRWNAWNGTDAKDRVIDTRDAVELIGDRGREVRPLRVLVINYEPVIASAGGNLLRQVTGFRDPHQNTDEHVKDMQLSSHGYLRVQRLPEIEAREYPAMLNRADGTPFHFTEDSYLHAWRFGQWPAGDIGCDYNDIIRRYDLVRRVDCGDVDEVWLQAVPGFGMWETTMAGPNAYWCNSDPVASPPDSLNGTNGTRLFVLTAFNYEREADVMIHDWGHRTESILGQKVYGGWEPGGIVSTTWDRFASVERYHKGQAGVGFCHYPPNAEKDYDYANPRFVSSDADCWLTYPVIAGPRKMVNRDNWGLPRALPTGVPDYQRNYLIWFFSRVPHAPGIAPDGRQANWWKYIAGFNDYTESR